MALAWTKAAAEELWTAHAGPFAIYVRPKGDGRWTWEVFRDKMENPTATGIARSFGSAKSVAEQLVNRSGLV